MTDPENRELPFCSDAYSSCTAFYARAAALKVARLSFFSTSSQ